MCSHSTTIVFGINQMQWMISETVFQLSSLSAMRTVSKSFFQRTSARAICFLANGYSSKQHLCWCGLEYNLSDGFGMGCSLPIEMIRPSHWFTNLGIDELVSSEYYKSRTKFMDALIAEEKATAEKHNLLLLSDVMSKTWATGTFWYTLALSSPSGLFTIFEQHIRPLFCTDYLEEFNLIMPFLWERNVGRIASHKLSIRVWQPTPTGVWSRTPGMISFWEWLPKMSFDFHHLPVGGGLG